MGMHNLVPKYILSSTTCNSGGQFSGWPKLNQKSPQPGQREYHSPHLGSLIEPRGAFWGTTSSSTSSNMSSNLTTEDSSPSSSSSSEAYSNSGRNPSESIFPSGDKLPGPTSLRGGGTSLVTLYPVVHATQYLICFPGPLKRDRG